MRKVLIVDLPGVGLRLTGERVVMASRGRREEVPISSLEEVRIFPRVSLSSDVLISLMERGVLVTLVDDKGDPKGVVMVPTSGGTVRTRREQLLSYYDERGLKLAKSFVEAATLFRAWVLKRLSMSRPEVSDRLLSLKEEIESIVPDMRALEGRNVDEVRSELMALEGTASSKYFEALSLVIPGEFFSGTRTRRPPRDPFNAAISYGNSLIYTEALKCAIFSGLDPFAGFLHVDRPGRFSLALDLAEEFIIYASHWPVITLFSKRVMGRDDFRGSPEKGVYLNYEGREKVIKAISYTLTKYVSYRGKKWRIRDLMLLRARNVVTFVRGESNYEVLVPWE